MRVETVGESSRGSSGVLAGRGWFLTLEGSEGCGKSTQTRVLAERLSATGRKVRVLREPGGTPLGEEIRHTLKHSSAGKGMAPEAELLLMNAARAQLVREVIRPALAAGEIVVCDRYMDSTVAYQGWGRGLLEARVRQILEFATGGTVPDLTLLLTVDGAMARERRRARAAGTGTGAATDRFEEEDEAFFGRVDAGFRAIAVAAPERVKVVDGAGSVEEVAERIWKVVAHRLSG